MELFKLPVQHTRLGVPKELKVFGSRTLEIVRIEALPAVNCPDFAATITPFFYPLIYIG